MRDPSRAFAVAWLACFGVACSFTSSGSGGPGSTPVQSSGATTPANGHASSPNQIDCSLDGTSQCTPGNQICCAAAGAQVSCQPGPTSCAGANQWVFECDEAADCPTGQVCCLNGNTFSCSPSCQGPDKQSCRTSAECGQGGTGACLVQSCNGGVFTELCSLGNGCSAQ